QEPEVRRELLRRDPKAVRDLEEEHEPPAGDEGTAAALHRGRQVQLVGIITAVTRAAERSNREGWHLRSKPRQLTVTSNHVQGTSKEKSVLGRTFVGVTGCPVIGCGVWEPVRPNVQAFSNSLADIGRDSSPTHI